MVLFYYIMKLNLEKLRTLKVELAGDTYRGTTYPKIRLQGLWLEDLGIKPSGRVAVVPLSPGDVLLRFFEPGNSVATKFQRKTTLILTITSPD